MGVITTSRIYKFCSDFTKFPITCANERVGFISLGAGILIESFKMMPEHSEAYYQHVVSVSALSEREDCDNGLLWRIDSDNAEPTELMEYILTAVYHGIAKYPGCFTEADKNNLTIAQRCVLDDKIYDGNIAMNSIIASVTIPMAKN